MQRRRFLATAAALSSTTLAAGCTGAPSDRTSTTTPTTADPTTQPTTSTATTPAVDEFWTGRSFRYLYAGAHVNAYTVTGDGPVFAFAVVAEGEQPQLVLDGATHEPADELPGSTGADAVFFDRNTDERRVVSYALPEPVDASSGSVADRDLSDDELSFLADPPVFSVDGVDLPASVERESEATGADVPVTVSVANDGGSAGIFRAATTSETYSGYDVAGAEIPAGGTGTLGLEASAYADDTDTVTVTWGSGSRQRTVEIEN